MLLAGAAVAVAAVGGQAARAAGELVFPPPILVVPLELELSTPEVVVVEMEMITATVNQVLVVLADLV